MGKKSRRIKPAKKRMPFVARTFEGLPNEGDWIALREFVPAASAVAKLKDGRSVTFCSLLPGGGPGLVRPNGDIWVGLQVMHNYGDPSRDLAHVIELAAQTEPGTPIKMTDPAMGDRLQDLIDSSAGFDVTMHDTFDFWLAEAEKSEAVEAALEQANEAIAPTVRLESVDSAYVTTMGDQTFLRWIRSEDESKLLTALAKLRAAGNDGLGDAPLIGIFRAHGLQAPVWEFETPDIEAIEAEAAAFAERLAEALADDTPLDQAGRSAKQALSTRQVTIR